MKFLDKFNEMFGFTRSERLVVLFLIVSFAAGAVIKYFKNSSMPAQAFDYSSQDSEFAFRSGLLDSSNAPMREEDSLAHAKAQPPGKDTSVVNINTASKDRLVHLPGIGEAIAERIVQYRRDHGQFHAVKELLKVKGIGKKKFDRIAKRCSIQ